jgi:lipopolysaccharide transport protein LptA
MRVFFTSPNDRHPRLARGSCAANSDIGLSYRSPRKAGMTTSIFAKISWFFCGLLLATPAFAANAPVAGKHDTNAPIEINSDALEVLQADHKAIFTGHVVAVQGDVHLKSEKMTVFYKAQEADGSAEKPAKTSAVPAATEKNSIEKIIVENNVFLTTAEETASGTNGIYDVENKKIYLNDNVVLTRDKNVMKGDKLVYDFATGKSVMNGSDSAVTAANPTGQKTRVKVLIIQNGQEKLPTDKK